MRLAAFSVLSLGLAGVAARIRSCLVPDPRPLRDPTQALSGEEPRVGHRARFSRPGNAQRHEETLQQKSRSLACPSPLGGAGCWQHGRLEEGARFAGYVATVSQLACCHPVIRSWPLGPRLGFSVTRSNGTLFTQRCDLWGLGRPVDSARCWRQWAKEACQGSAGAAHGFSKVGLDVGDCDGLAGPQLLVKQMETWLPLWLDSRRANAKQLADQEDMGEPSPRLSLEEVDNVCKTYKHTAGLDHDCVNPKAVLQLPVELKACQTFELVSHDGVEAQAIRRSPHCRPHSGPVAGAVAAPKAIGAAVGERPQCGLCLGLSRQSVRPHSIVVAAARGGSSRRLPCYSTGHDRFWAEGRKTSFPTRLLACWCASYEGWRFLEADKCAIFPFRAFGTILPGCSGAPGNSGNTPPDLQSTTFRGTWRELPRWCRSSLPKRAGFWWKASKARDLPLSKGKSKVLIDGPDKLKHALLQQLVALGIDEYDMARNVGADLQLGRRRRALVVKERLARAAKRTKHVRQLRKAGAHIRNLTLTGSNAGNFGVPRFWTSLRHSSNRSESTRPKPHIGSAVDKTLPSRCWPTPRKRGQKTSIRPFDMVDKSSWLGQREFGKALQTSTPCRPRCAALWPGSVVSSGRGAAPPTRQPPLFSRACGWDGAHSLRGTSRPTTAPRSTSWQWRPRRWAIEWTGHLFCGQTALHTGTSPRARFSGKPSGHSSFLANWRVGHCGIGACWSSWSREASGPRKGLRGSGARRTAAASSATMDPAPCSTVATSARPCRQKETCTSHRRCAWLQALWVRNTGSSLHMAFFPTLAPFCQQDFLNVRVRFCGTIGSQTGGLLEGHIFTDGSSSGSGALRRAGWAVVAVDDVGNLKAAAYGAVPSDVLPGQSARDGEDYPAAMAGHITLDPFTLYVDCEGTIATVNGPKHKALGAQGPRAHVWNRLLVSHDEVRAAKVKGHATQHNMEAGHTSHLCKRRNDFADTFA